MSPTLLNALAEKGIAACGSVNLKRKFFPAIPAAALKATKRGDSETRQKNNMNLVSWKDA
jgi:hypothetical protein